MLRVYVDARRLQCAMVSCYVIMSSISEWDCGLLMMLLYIQRINCNDQYCMRLVGPGTIFFQIKICKSLRVLEN